MNDASLPPAAPAHDDARTWIVGCHLAGLLGLVLPSFGAMIGPLVVWLLKKADDPRIDANGREALNFQISIFIYSWVLGVIGALTWFILIGFVFLGMAILVGLFGVVMAVVAAVKASNGEDQYRYPLTIRLL
ncbi:MAG: DUF4870 domain-containing protein [Limisphaerales bacterium]